MIYTADFPIHFKPVARPEAVVTGPTVRFTLLTSRLIRLEYSPVGAFEDRPSQVFWYREQPVPDYQVRRETTDIQIETAYLVLNYTPGSAAFARDTLKIWLKERDQAWHYGDIALDNLSGTARTLDQAHGAIRLETGLISRSGWALVDDSDRLVFNDRGWLTPRDAVPGSQDLYYFGYGNDYASCLRDYCRVAGQVPLLPRWALGNWWSRYWAYGADELLQLMREFREHEVPLSVCIVDMDWHITDTGNRSSGWTGYTWNRELFPDPPAFLEALHRLGLKTALNLHPAQGVYPHEAQYQEMAERMGIDPGTAAPVPFDIADPEFARAYFELLHHPYETQGVDFWWLDWQQGTESGMRGLDPLWWLNHLHFFDLGRDAEKRPFIFSRWGGLGNHRYPIGFSGDTVVSWETLAFQPYFTATAANVAYGWWSHDIGGHMGGIEEAELYTRWVQFGVFSPILRLHSTKNAYHERLPWGYDAETLRVTREAMQLRHRLIPYLYTMSWLDHNASVPPIRPMYYDYPTDEQAYHCPNQYTFGSQLIAAPFSTPSDPETRLSRQVVWLPPGQWFDLFSGLSYQGDAWHAVYGGLNDIPVFVKAGAIIPLGPKRGWGGVDIPEVLELHVFPGADGRFELYEDDGKSAYSLIPFSQTWKPHELCFEIGAAQGETDHLPAERTFTLLFRGVTKAPVMVEKNGQAFDCAVDYDEQTAVLAVREISLAPTDTLSATIRAEDDPLLVARDYRLSHCRRLLRACRLNTDFKQMLDGRLSDVLVHPATLGDFELVLSESIVRALAEIITGAGAHRFFDPVNGDERIVLWNNAASADVSFYFVGRPLAGWSAVRRTGPLPKFAVFKSGEQLSIDLGSGVERFDSVVDWLASLSRGFRSEVAGDLDVVIEFNFGGQGSHQAHACISGGKLTVAHGRHENPDLIIDADAVDWLELVNGEVDPRELFLAGKVQISGDMALVMRLADLVGSAAQTQFGAELWRLSVNYLDMHTLEFGRSGA